MPAQAATWPTPDAFISNDGESPESFLTRQKKHKERGINGNGMGLPLAMAAKMWPTPETRDWKGANQTALQDRGAKGAPLNEVAVLWATPTSSENSNRTTQMAPSHDNGHGIVLAGQAADMSRLWATPRSHEVGNYQYSRGDKTKPVATVTGQACSLPVQVTYPVGGTSSNDRRSLNPLFVEWLMGWPPGWTLGAWTDFGCLATALSRFKRRMRSALSSLGSPAEAPPPQLSLI